MKVIDLDLPESYVDLDEETIEKALNSPRRQEIIESTLTSGVIEAVSKWLSNEHQKALTAEEQAFLLEASIKLSFAILVTSAAIMIKPGTEQTFVDGTMTFGAKTLPESIRKSKAMAEILLSGAAGVPGNGETP